MRTRQAEFWSHLCAPSAKEHLPGGSGRRGGGLPAADGGWSGARLRARSPTPATGWYVEMDGTTATTATSASWCWRCREQWLLLLQEQNKRGYCVNLTVLFNHIIPIITVIFFSAFDSRNFRKFSAGLIIHAQRGPLIFDVLLTHRILPGFLCYQAENVFTH